MLETIREQVEDVKNSDEQEQSDEQKKESRKEATRLFKKLHTSLKNFKTGPNQNNNLFVSPLYLRKCLREIKTIRKLRKMT